MLPHGHAGLDGRTLVVTAGSAFTAIKRASKLEETNQMSKIMRLMYAEARAAREAATNRTEDRVHDRRAPASSKIQWWTLPVSNPVESATTTIQWWTTQIAKVGTYRI